MKKALILCSAIIAMLGSACTIRDSISFPESRGLSPTNPANITLYTADTIQGKRITAIGYVTAVHTSSNDGSKAATLLAQEAARIGAHAVVSFRLGKINSHSSHCTASGIAVLVQ